MEADRVSSSWRSGGLKILLGLMVFTLFDWVLRLEWPLPCHFPRETTQPATAQQTVSIKPKIVYVDKVKHDTIRIKGKNVYVPYEKKNYLPDTARRQRMERDTLIAGVKLKGNRLQIDRIDPRGVVVEENILLPENGLTDGTELQIDAQGKAMVQVDPKEARKTKRRQFWRKVGNTAKDIGKVAGGVALGTLLL